MNILQHTSLLKTFLGLILLCQCIEDTCSMDDRYQNHRIHRRHTPFLPEDHWKGRPDFGTTNTNVTVMVNGTADLRCPISHIMDSSLSFVRRKDFHILSNGHTLFTNDPRIEIIHRAKTIDWILRIKQASFQDSGNYDCQVSLKSGSHTLPFQLHVVSPRAVISGSSEFHLDRGSTLSLNCAVNQATTDTQYVFWYHGERMINYDKSDRVSVQTRSSKDKKQTNSTLVIRNADPSQSGNYTCQPSNAIGASIQVFVSEDRHSEPLLRPDAKDSLSPGKLGHPVGNKGHLNNGTGMTILCFTLWLCQSFVMPFFGSS